MLISFLRIRKLITIKLCHKILLRLGSILCTAWIIPSLNCNREVTNLISMFDPSFHLGCLCCYYKHGHLKCVIEEVESIPKTSFSYKRRESGHVISFHE